MDCGGACYGGGLVAVAVVLIEAMVTVRGGGTVSECVCVVRVISGVAVLVVTVGCNGDGNNRSGKKTDGGDGGDDCRCSICDGDGVCERNDESGGLGGGNSCGNLKTEL